MDFSFDRGTKVCRMFKGERALHRPRQAHEIMLIAEWGQDAWLWRSDTVNL